MPRPQLQHFDDMPFIALSTRQGAIHRHRRPNGIAHEALHGSYYHDIAGAGRHTMKRRAASGHDSHFMIGQNRRRICLKPAASVHFENCSMIFQAALTFIKPYCRSISAANIVIRPDAGDITITDAGTLAITTTDSAIGEAPAR